MATPAPKCSGLGRNRECDDCTIAAKRISRDISSRTLKCSKKIYPLVVKCQTMAEPGYLVQALKRKLGLEYNRIHAAYRRSVPQGGEAQGRRRRWHAVHVPSVIVAHAAKSIGLIEPTDEQRVFLSSKNGDSTVREVSILLDIKGEVAENGQIVATIQGVCQMFGQLDGLWHPSQTGHASLHRLRWFEECYPKPPVKEGEKVTYKPGHIVVHKNREGSRLRALVAC